AMVKDFQLDPIHGSLIHADFMEISMDQLLELSVDVEIVGEAEGVKIGGGMLEVVTRALEIECLPANIPDSIPVDVRRLQINEYVRVKNLAPDPRYKTLSDPDLVIVTVIPPIKEEVPVEEAPAEPAEPELIKKGKVAEEPEEEK
ncbi:MAG: 50S ribosomal protein L25, partial [Acidobacteriota bacterium]